MIRKSISYKEIGNKDIYFFINDIICLTLYNLTQIITFSTL